MSLELSLVIKGEQSGAKKAMDDTAAGIENLGNKAKVASGTVQGIGDAVGQVASEAPAAATGVDQLGEAAVKAGGKFSDFKSFAIGAVGGIAGAIATAGLELAFSLAAGAAMDYFNALTNSPENVKADLEAHKGLIASIKGLWNEAEGAASSYGLTSEAGLRVEARANIGRLESDFGTQLSGLHMGQILNAGGIGGASTAARAPFDASIAKLRQDLKDGRADIIGFREEVAKIAEALPVGSEGFAFAERILGDTQKAAELQAELQRAVDLYKALTGDAEAAATALGKAAEGMTANGTQAAGALTALREYAALMATIGGVRVTLPGGSVVAGAPGSVGGSFAAGGFTGHAPADRIAGVVHGREYVFDADATARIGVGNLEAIRRGVRGYAGGGLVGGGSVAAGGTGGIGVVDELFSLRDALRQFGTALWNTRNPIQAFAQVLGSVSQSFLNKALGAAGDALMSLIPGFATGTNSAPGGLAWVGEDGPELVRLPRGSQVFSAGESARMSGGDTHNWFISTPNPRAFAESRSSVARTAGRLLGASRRHS